MAIDVTELRRVLELIRSGGEISFDEVQAINWTVPDDLDALVQRIYRDLQVFASDQDVRVKDADYDKSWRSAMSEFLDELNRETRQSG